MDYLIQMLAVLIILLVFSAFFSASETALTGANRIRLKNQAEQGDKKSKRALGLMNNYDRTLSALLIGNNIVNTLMASLATVVCTTLLGGGSAVGIATLVVTVVIILFGEVIPKSFAKSQSETVIKWTSAPLGAVSFIFKPLTFALEGVKKLCIPRKKGGDPTVTEDELKVILEEIEDEGVMEEDRSELLQSALEFGDITVDEVLTPRVDIFAVEESSTQEEVLQVFLEQQFSRLPVYKGNIDNIVGVVNQKDFFAALLTGKDASMAGLMQPCLYVPPKKHISDLMGELQRKKLHLAVVSDQYGGTLGIITLEDILEELVGEIWDEHEEVTYMMVPLGDGSYEISGELPVEELFDNLAEESHIPPTDAATAAGLALEKLGHIPSVGEQFVFGPFLLKISRVDEQRILKLQAVLLPEEETAEN